MPFSEDLWDGFEKIVGKVDLNIKLCKEYHEWFVKRSKIEKEYGEKLHELCKVHPGGKTPAVDKSEKTLKDALLTLTDSGIRMGIKHTDAATQMLNEIIKPLEAFIKQSEGEKKRLESDGKKKIKVHLDGIAAANKARESYVKGCRESESAKEAYTKAEAEFKTAPEVKKAKIQINVQKALQKRSMCIEKANALEAAYKTAVQTANEIQQKLHHDELPAVLAELQKLVEDQWRSLEKAMKAFLDVLPQELTATIGVMQTSIGTDLSWNNDLQDFIEANRTNVTGPTPMDFVSYEGKTPDELPGEKSAEKPTSSAPTPATTAAPAPAPAPASAPAPAPAPASAPVAAPAPAQATTTPATTEPAPASTSTSTAPAGTPAPAPTEAPKSDNLFDAAADPFAVEKKKADPVDTVFF